MLIGRRHLMMTGFVGSVAAWRGCAKAEDRSFKDVGELRESVMVAFKAAPDVGKVIADPMDPAKFTAVINGTTLTSDVTNLFGYLAAYPDENADEAIARFVRTRLDGQDTSISDENLVVVIRTRDYVEETKRVGLNVLHEPAAAGLFRVYMVDRPDSMSPLNATDLSGRPLEDVRKVALGNVQKWLPRVVSDDALGAGVLYYVEGNTMLSPSLMLLDEFWKSIAARFPGDVLIAIPRRDQLFIFDDNGNSKSEALARGLIRATIEENFNLLSPLLYARRKGRIVTV